MNQSFKLKSSEMRQNNVVEKQTSKSGQNYKTFDDEASVRKLVIELIDGTIEILDYAYFMRARYSPLDGSITLIYTWGSVILQGERLRLLIRDFDCNLPKEIICNDKRYNQLAKSNDFVVNALLYEI